MYIYIPTLENLFETGDDGGLKDELSKFAPNDPCIEHLDLLLNVMRGRSAPLPSLDTFADQDCHFIRNIWRLSEAVDSDRHLRTDKTISLVHLADSTYDFLAKPYEWPWTIAKLLNFIALSRIKPRRRAAVLTAMRNDGTTLLEFVAHYRALGFEHIFVFSNDNDDGTDEMLSILAGHRIVTFIDNKVSPGTEPLRKAHEYSIHFLPELRDFNWVLYVDSDELLIVPSKFSYRIDAVLDAVEERYPDGSPSAICYAWKWYGCKAFQRTPGLQLEIYKYARVNSTVKSMIKMRDVMSMRSSHYPHCKLRTFFVNSAFDRIDSSQPSKPPANLVGGWINHYWNKSFEEYLVKKVRSEKQQDLRNYNQWFAWNVPETSEYLDPTPVEVIELVRAQYNGLLGLAGVRELNASIGENFHEFLTSLIDPQELRRQYDELNGIL